MLATYMRCMRNNNLEITTWAQLLEAWLALTLPAPLVARNYGEGEWTDKINY